MGGDKGVRGKGKGRTRGREKIYIYNDNDEKDEGGAAGLHPILMTGRRVLS
jgi:hypothetical protein